MAQRPEASWPAVKPRMVSPASLKAYARNPRTHTDEQINQIVRSIEQFGFTNAILVDEQNQVIAGHGRLAAARKMGLQQVPIITARGWTEEQRRAYVIADNQIALNAGWDEALLKLELADLQQVGFDLGLTGFGADDLAALFPADQEARDEAADADAPPPPENPTTRRGDVWILGDHRIRCGDSTSEADVAALLLGAKPHLMVTDPPYGVNYDPTWRHAAKINNSARTGKVQNDGVADWREAWRLFPGDVAYVWHAAINSRSVIESLIAAKFAMRAEIIWAKNRLVIGRGDYHWQHEPCIYAVREGKRGHWAGDRSQTTLWAIPQRAKDGNEDAVQTHGTQKPVECMRRPMLNNSKRGDAVYEPFSGSGTSIIAAEATGRQCFAMELDPAYVDMAVLRWEQFSGRTAVLEATGEGYQVTRFERLSATEEAA